VKINNFFDVPYWSQGESLRKSSSRAYMIPIDVDIPIVIGYVPPKSYEGNGGGRIVSSDRGSRGNTGRPKHPIFALAPNHPRTIPAETVTQSPTLFWYLSEPSESSIVFKLDPKGKTKGWKKPIKLPENETQFKAGLHQIPLDKLGIQLSPGVSYRWSVTVDEERRGKGKNPYSSAGIRFVGNSDEFVQNMVANQDDLAKAQVYAKDGLWYDAFSSLTNYIQSHKNDCQLIKARATLLEHEIVGLAIVAKVLNKEAGCS